MDLLQLGACALAWKGLADFSWRTSLVVVGVSLFAMLEIRGSG